MGLLRDAQYPAPTRITLGNGLRVALQRVGNSPKTLVRVVIQTGPERSAVCGVPAVLASVFLNGTAALGAARMQDSLARKGGSLAVSTGPERIELTADVLEPFAVATIQLLSEIVRKPVLNSAALRSSVAAADAQGAATRTAGDSVASSTFYSTLFPNGEFGRVCDSGSRFGVEFAQSVRRYYAAEIAPAHTTVYVVGRYRAEAVVRAARSAFGGWVAGKSSAPLVARPRPARSTIVIVHRPGAKQVALVVGAPVAGGDVPLARLQVTNALLGGGLTSRITTNIREAKGYAYGPGSRVESAASGATYWAEQAQVAADVAWPALREILFEIRRLGTAAPSPDEVTSVEHYVVGRSMLQHSTRAGWADALEGAQLTASSMPHASADNVVSRVSPRDVQRTVRSYLGSRHLTIVVAGDTTALGSQVAAIRHALDGADIPKD